MFENLKSKNSRQSKYKDMPNAGSYPSRGFSHAAGATTFTIKGNEASRLVRCRVCGFPCDKERDSKAKEGSWAGFGINEGQQLTAGTSIGDISSPDSPTDTTVTIPQDTYTALLLTFEGDDGSTTFTDSSPIGRSVTPHGDVQIDTAQFPFGTSSGLFDGTTDWLSILDDDAWSFGTGDFTIDTQIRFNSVASTQDIVAQRVDASNVWRFRWANTNNLTFSLLSNGVTVININNSWTPSTNTWYHIEVDKRSGSYYMFVDGSRIGTVQASTVLITNLNNLLTIGAISSGANAFNGWLKETRVSKGTARHISNFTAPSSSYVTQGTVTTYPTNPDKYYNRNVQGGCPMCGTYTYAD